MLEHFDCRLNLDHVFDLDQSLWSRLTEVYAATDGWLGYSDGKYGQKGIPYWFGFDETRKYISASVEPGGIQFSGFMEEGEWDEWVAKMKAIGTRILGFRIGEIEWGEVGHDIEWVDDDRRPG